MGTREKGKHRQYFRDILSEWQVAWDNSAIHLEWLDVRPWKKVRTHDRNSQQNIFRATLDF
jgi:hypothetical protein